MCEYSQLQLPLLRRAADLQRQKRLSWNVSPAGTALSRKRWKC